MTISCEFVAPIRRSKQIKAVCAALNAQVRKGSIRSFQEGKLRVGRMNVDIDWPDGRSVRLRIDIEAATLTLPSLLSEVSVGSQLHRDVKALVRSAQGHNGVSAKAMLRMTEQGGNVSLAVTVVSDDYEFCTRRLLELASETFALL